jgi:hypothetical protein
MKKKEEKKNKKPIPFLSRIMRNLYPFMLILSGIIIILSITLILLTKAQWFRYWVSGYLFSVINNELAEGTKFEFRDISFSHLIGFKIYDASLTFKGDTLFKSSELHAGISLRPLFNNKIIINHIKLKNTKINIYRSAVDSLWIFDKILKPSTDTLPSEPSELFINIKRFDFNNAEIIFHDSTVTYLKSQKLDYNHMHFNWLDFSLNSEINLKRSVYKATIENLNCIEENANIVVNNLHFSAILDSTGASIEDFYIKTQSNEISLNANIQNYNVFSGQPDVNNAEIQANITSPAIDLKQIMRFIPVDIPLTGICDFDIEVKGILDSLDIYVENLQYKKSRLSFRTLIQNIISGNPNIDYNFDQSSLSKKDLENILNAFDISGIPEFGHIDISKLSGNYYEDSLSVELDFTGSSGNLKGHFGLGFKDILTYQGEITTNNLDLSFLLADESLKSSINSELNFVGSGTNPKNLLIKTRLNLSNSKIFEYSINNLILDAKTPEPGIIHIDTLIAEYLNNTESSYNKKSGGNNKNIALNGFLNIINPENPKYNISAYLNAFNPSSIFSNNSFPDYMDAILKINGEGFQPDSITADIEFDIQKWQYSGNELKADSIIISLKRDYNQDRSLSITSGFLNLNFEGNYTYSKLIPFIQHHAKNFSALIDNQIAIVENRSTPLNAPLTDSIPIRNLSGNNFLLSLNIKDKELLKNLLKFKKLNTDMDIGISFISDSFGFSFKFDKFQINEFRMIDSASDISINTQLMQGIFGGKTTENNTTAYNLDLSIINKKGININDLNINNIDTKINYSNNQLNLITSAIIDNHYDISAKSEFAIEKNTLNINFSHLKLNYFGKIDIRLEEPLKMYYSQNELNIENLKLTGNQFKLLDIKGTAGTDYFKNMDIRLFGYKLENIMEFLPQNELELGKSLKGSLDSLKLTLNGKFDNTDLGLYFNINELSFNNKRLGEIHSELHHSNNKLNGNIVFNNKLSKDTNDILLLQINEAPINLSLTSENNRFINDKPINIILKTSNFPLEILSPFITDINNLRGFANINLNVKAKNLKQLNYHGSVNYQTDYFLLNINNMNYSSEGTITFVTDTIFVDNLKIINHPSDLTNGEAIAKGKVILKDLNPKEFDIKVSSKKMKVLSKASMKSIPSLYGDFIISFGPKPLNISGTPDEPTIDGDINTLSASLFMPSISSTEVKKSTLKYEIINNDEVKFSFESDTSDIAKKDESGTTEKSKDTGSPLDIDIGLKFKGRFILTMDIAGIGQLFAEIGASSKDDILRYVSPRGSEESQIYGTDILVKEGSSLKLFKMFDTKGKISFPTGVIDNPELDLEATYKGQRYSADQVIPFEVKMYIKGTKEQPWITFSYSIDGDEKTGDSAQINEDALLLLMVGKTKSELNSSETGNIDYGAEATSIASSVASTALTDFVQSTGFIQSADIDIGTSLQSWDQARMKFSGEVKGIRWTLGGSVAEFANNNEISIDIPLINNIVLQLTKITNSNQPTTTKTQKDWELKIRGVVIW